MDATETQSKALHLKCVNCGAMFDAPNWPYICCPSCKWLGQPDRVGSHLLSAGWSCEKCGEPNDGSTNFCLTCGTGLTLRCLKCEAPVYKATCDRCGTHQARARRFISAEERRQEWIPILRSHIQKEQAQSAKISVRQIEVDDSQVIQGWRPIIPHTPQPAAPAPSPPKTSSPTRTRPKRRISSGRLRLGLILVISGIGFLLSSERELASERVSDFLQQVEQLLPLLWSYYVAPTWADFQGNINQLSTLSPDQQGYTILFGIGVFMLALLPVLILLAARLAKRLFP